MKLANANCRLACALTGESEGKAGAAWMRWLRAIKSFLLEHQGILLLLYVDVPLSGFFSQGTRNIRLLVRGLGDSDSETRTRMA